MRSLFYYILSKIWKQVKGYPFNLCNKKNIRFPVRNQTFFIRSTTSPGKLHSMRHTGNGLSFIEADLTKQCSRWYEKHALIASFL